MVRLIVIIAIACGIYWCFNNINIESIKQSVSSGIKNEKTIKAVNQTRTQLGEDNDNAMNY